VGFDNDAQRRERSERPNGIGISDRRLSRDLEEGFEDESDDDELQDNRRITV
jgi:hypothetical protein